MADALNRTTLTIDRILEGSSVGTIDLAVDLDRGNNTVKEYTLHLGEKSLDVLQYVPEGWSFRVEHSLPGTRTLGKVINAGDPENWGVSRWFVTSLHEIGHAREFVKGKMSAGELEDIYERVCTINREKTPEDIKTVVREEIKAWTFAVDLLTKFGLPSDFMQSVYRFVVFPYLRSYLSPAFSQFHEPYIVTKDIDKFRSEVKKMFFSWARDNFLRLG